MWAIKIENDTKDASCLDFMFPLKTDDLQVVNYMKKVVAQVDESTAKYSKISQEEFFRSSGKPIEFIQINWLFCRA